MIGRAGVQVLPAPNDDVGGGGAAGGSGDTAAVFIEFSATKGPSLVGRILNGTGLILFLPTLFFQDRSFPTNVNLASSHVLSPIFVILYSTFAMLSARVVEKAIFASPVLCPSPFDVEPFRQSDL